jgi:electron transfer flavoprotein alpha subunit
MHSSIANSTRIAWRALPRTPGAVQPLTWIKDAPTIAAANKDAGVPLFEVTDIGPVRDVFQVVPEVEALFVN